MPSIDVVPESPVESPGGGPVIAGVTFRRPSARSFDVETVRSVKELANGETRSYDRGRRRVWSLSWSKLTTGELDRLVAAVGPSFVSYRDDVDSPTFDVSTEEGVTSQAVAGTFPVRHAASITLRERKPFR